MAASTTTKPRRKGIGAKLIWPVFSARLEPGVVRGLLADLRRLGLTRGEWGREVLTREAAKLRARAGNGKD